MADIVLGVYWLHPVVVREVDPRFDLELVVCPIVREPDGLAMSSRNRYLSAKERDLALVLSHAVQAIYVTFHAGQTNVAPLLDAAHSVMAIHPEVRIDYLAIVHPDTLLPLDKAVPGALAAVAAHVGATRLIDNTLL